MIKFVNNCDEKPYKQFRSLYNLAKKNKQKYIEAISISSFSRKNNEVESRFVNAKFLDNKSFIFFSNYNSPKAMQFKNHNQISGLFFWSSINTQIRIKAKIKKTSKDFNNIYFKNRSKRKNALAISSQQSKKIQSYDLVKKSYESVLNEHVLDICPSYWGGFTLVPYYFEFWTGNSNRINKRHVFIFEKNKWEDYYLEP